MVNGRLGDDDVTAVSLIQERVGQLPQVASPGGELAIPPGYTDCPAAILVGMSGRHKMGAIGTRVIAPGRIAQWFW